MGPTLFYTFRDFYLFHFSIHDGNFLYFREKY
jgi:hypothetical protein